MTLPKPYYQDSACTVYCADFREILPLLPKVDCVITDPPFSARTHSGHDASANGHAGAGRDKALRSVLGYHPWGEEDVKSLLNLIKCDGWIVAITDHVLAPFWEKYQPGRYVFAPLPSFTPGRSVRLSGDGPSSWTDWIIVSRTANQSRWGTLPGGYINRGASDKMGGKPLGLMLSLVKDYSRTGDIVLDPCMGQGTTLRAAKDLGRYSIGIDIAEECCFQAARRLAQEVLPLDTKPARVETQDVLVWNPAMSDRNARS